MINLFVSKRADVVVKHGRSVFSLFYCTCFHCNSIAGCTRTLLVGSSESEGEVFAACQWWQTTNPIHCEVTFIHLAVA